jgi:hypothetical protein
MWQNGCSARLWLIAKRPHPDLPPEIPGEGVRAQCCHKEELHPGKTLRVPPGRYCDRAVSFTIVSD